MWELMELQECLDAWVASSASSGDNVDRNSGYKLQFSAHQQSKHLSSGQCGQAFCVRSPAIMKFREVPLTDQPFRPCQEETVIDCRFAVGDILDVVASLGGCDLDVLVSGAGCDPHRDDWASDGGRTVVTSVSSDIQKSR